MSGLASKIHTRQTARFIQENPVEIIIDRTQRVSDGKGGWRSGATTMLRPQCVRKVGSTRISGTQELTTSDGRIVVPTAALIGLPDLDLEAGDKFTIGEDKWEIIKVDRDPPWRVQALVVEHR